MWPRDAQELVVVQEQLAYATAELWHPAPDDISVAGVWVCFPRGLTGRGAAGDPAWAATTVMRGRRPVEERVVSGVAGAPYEPGLLALRLGPLMQQVVRRTAAGFDVLMLDATGRDHPRRAGLALHLGAELDVPTIGITHRPLLAEGGWPGEGRGEASPLTIDGEVVASWLRTRPGTRPLVVHPGWRVDLDTAVEVVTAAATRRTPEPLRRARHLAREARMSTGSGSD